METREQRGAAIAELGQIKRRGRHCWHVKSQTGSGTWVVDIENRKFICTCPDYETRAEFCKHIFAVEIWRHRSPEPDASVTEEPKRYSQDWPAYNKAQTTEQAHFSKLLRQLCDGIEFQQQPIGRPKTPLGDVVFACVYKVYTGKSGRRAMGTLNECRSQGHMVSSPNYNTMSRYMNSSEMSVVLRNLVQESAAPLRGVEQKFAADATGFSTKTYQRYFDHKWGGEKKKARFVKAHAMCGTFTHVVSDMI